MGNGKRGYHRALAAQLFLRMLVQPFLMTVYGLAWFRLYSLCRYGRLNRNLPVLFGCALFLCAYLFAYLILLFWYRRKNSGGSVWAPTALEADGISAGDGGREERILWRQVRKAAGGRRRLYLFCSRGRFYALDLGKMEERQRRFLKEKLGGLPFWRRAFLRPAAYLILAAFTFGGAAGVVYSGIGYNGKLARLLSELESTRWADYTHQNLYTDGIDGLLTDLGKEIQLPAHLKLENSFSMHFAADGTVTSLSMGISGFDGQYRPAGSWTIHYEAGSGGRLRIDVGGIGSPDWQPEKDLQPLLDALRVIPFQETVQAWPREEEYGVLFYGERSWGYRTDGIRYIDRKGRIELPAYAAEEIKGPSVSVFVPGKEEELTPVRYLFCEDVTKERNVAE